MEILQLITIIGLSMEVTSIYKRNCQEEMSYDERYGYYVYDIFCNNLNIDNIDELKNVTVYKEVRLTIKNSNLYEINADLFENVPKTRELIITKSRINFANNSNSSSIFENLYQLQILNIANNNLSDLPVNFLKDLDNLKVLDVSNNNLSDLKNDTFKNVANLEELNLNNNKFVSFNKIPFCEVLQLKRLYLQNNDLKTLKNSSINCLQILKILMLDYNNIVELIRFSHLRYLVYISLSYNKIENLNNAFEGLAFLENLNLEGNKIKTIKWSHFCCNFMLQKLNLQNNLINLIEADTFVNLTSLEELNLHNNSLSKIPIFDIKSLKTLILSYNNITIENKEFHNLHNLESLNLNNCNIRKLTKDMFQYLNYLRVLDLSNNNIILTSSSFYGLHNVIHLILKSNSFIELPNYAFQFVANLEILDLSYNNLKDLNNLTFHNLKNLETLNLSYNHLESLSEKVLIPLENLRTLDLVGNRLKYIEYDIIVSLLSNLKSIKIRENQLSCSFLSKMLQYFRNKTINYTVNEKLSYDEENVAGIHCQEYDKFNSSFKRTNEILLNDTAVLNEIYHIAKDDNKSLNASLSTTLLILCLVVLVLFLSVVGISYRIYIIVKRRNYISDEIELLDTRMNKWNGMCN
ncbi:hypothetical protein ILUMI_07521 [Ignelater luminosus]|uniref:Uncharacterized protein n=1 Tax=Ignelater luminosus TaxID=2038154 RepID=A0A8K0GBI5_IGNLU|nr:hypothetical protein ILUMI_07521 [Ignelater luminosus]